MAALVGTALLYTALAVAAGLLVGSMVSTPEAVGPQVLVSFALSIAGLAAARYAERVLAERLGQDYVLQLRRGLIRHALDGSSVPSLGITVARTTNDLSSVRNWVAQGIAPLVAAVPLIAGCLGALAGVDWRLGVAVGIPVLLLGVVLLLLSRPAFGRARALRRLRGRMAARISDTVHAAPAIVAAGGINRELRRLDRDGRRVADAAVHRARTAGALRAAAMSTPLLASGALATAAALGGVDAAGLAMALTIVGVLGAPLAELGRVVEYRQNYRAARRIIAPLLATALSSGRAAPEAGWPEGPAGLSLRGLEIDGTPVPVLEAGPGERILLRSADAARVHAVFAQLAAGRSGTAECRVNGVPLGMADDRTRRRLLGYAYAGAWIESGTIARAVRYRMPDAGPEDVRAALAAVGLRERVESLREGEKTRLRRGGQPLGREGIARLQLARASLGQPPLLLLEDIDADLDAEGLERLNRLVDGYAGTVLCSTARPERLAGTWRNWDVDGRG
jgi:ABC-type multidrug transport system fused ATPase/permease subunit